MPGNMLTEYATVVFCDIVGFQGTMTLFNFK